MNAVEMMQGLFLRSGAGWVLWFLVALSIASAVIAVERWLFYRSVDVDLRAVAERLDTRLSAGSIAGAIADLRASPSVAASIAAAGLRLAPRGPQAVREAMESAVALERGRLEKRLAFLGTVGSNAPFVGLFGTVIGVIHAFEELGHAAPGHGAAAASQVASAAVMSSIAEALVATAVGILVALPAIAAYNYLKARVASLLAGSDVLTHLVLAYLVERAPAGPAAPAQEVA
jgi:biopolymer transport protein ExbB